MEVSCCWCTQQCLPLRPVSPAPLPPPSPMPCMLLDTGPLPFRTTPPLQLGTVESVTLTMRELYSSRVRNFRVKGRQTHPRRDGPDLAASIHSDAWELLGEFAAENKRGAQVGACQLAGGEGGECCGRRAVCACP